MTSFVTLKTRALEGNGNRRDSYPTSYCKVERDGIVYVAKARELRDYRKNFSPHDGHVRLPKIYRFVKTVNGGKSCFVTIGEKRSLELIGELVEIEERSYKAPKVKVIRGDKTNEVEPYFTDRVRRISDYIGKISEDGEFVQINVEWDTRSKTFVANKEDYRKMCRGSKAIGRALLARSKSNGGTIPDIFSFIGYDFDSDTARIAPAKNKIGVWEIVLSDRSDV